MKVQIFDSRVSMGQAAALAVAETVRALFGTQPRVRMVFAAAQSQDEFLDAFSGAALDWTRIDAFHMDEYAGLDSFAQYLQSRLFDKITFGSVHLIDGLARDVAAECARYTELLHHFPVDVVCLGIGENCHIAFNDPPVADFHDPTLVKVVELDQACREQQVHDGCFPSLETVPTRAITLTIPALLSARHIFGVVPGLRKAEAVHHTLHSPVSERYPSTALRQHPSVSLFLDRDSSKWNGS